MEPFYDENVDQPIQDLETLPAELARTRALKMPVPRPPKRHEDNLDEPEGHLAVDVYETPTELVVESAIAGVDPDELDVVATTESLTIKGRRRKTTEVHKNDYLHQECWWGKFSRTILLPQEVDPQGASVRFKNGILTVYLPKADWDSPKKLKVSRGD